MEKEVILIDEKTIKERIKQLADQINHDYEGKEFKNFNAVIGNSVYLTRKNNEIIVRKDLNEIKPEEEILFKVRYETRLNKYFLENEILTNIKPNQKNINNLQNKIWYIIRSDFYQSNYKEEIKCLCLCKS